MKYPKEFEMYWNRSRYSKRADFAGHKKAIYNGWLAGRKIERRYWASANKPLSQYGLQMGND